MFVDQSKHEKAIVQSWILCFFFYHLYSMASIYIIAVTNDEPLETIQIF